MVADHVASYTLILHEGVTYQDIETELRETVEMMKGVQRWGTLELPEGGIAFEIHLHGQTEKEVAIRTAERVYKLIDRFDMASVEYHGIEIPTDVEMAKDKWQGRDAVDDIVKKIDGVNFIRLDYYLRGLSFDDLGIADAHTEMLYVKALQQWPNKSVNKEAIRRIRDHFERLGELAALESPKLARGRTGEYSETLSSQPTLRPRVKPTHEKLTRDQVLKSAGGKNEDDAGVEETAAASA